MFLLQSFFCESMNPKNGVIIVISSSKLNRSVVILQDIGRVSNFHHEL